MNNLLDFKDAGKGDGKYRSEGAYVGSYVANRLIDTSRKLIQMKITIEFPQI